jgi:glycosyltransferase involved in cell wall biosynthesis
MLFTIKKKIIIAVIPALNEEKTIENVLINTKKYVDKIILVDDGSTDNTAKISEQYANVIRHSKNQGYGKSINDGFELAKKKGADIILTLDGDGQHLAEDILLFTDMLEKDLADIVVGKRPYQARLMEYIFANYGKKRGISDPLCGMKAYKTKVYDDVGFFENFTSIGTQLTFTAFKKGYRIKEIPIQLRKREDTPRFGRKIKANLKLLVAYLKLINHLNKINKKKLK